MKYPELLTVPALVLADYFLTLLSATEREKKYADHFAVEHFELNPVWQNQVARRKWFNPKHLLLTVTITLALVFLAEYAPVPEPFVRGTLGCLIVFFGMTIGRHLTNLMVFQHAINNPEDISGRLTMKHGMVLSVSLYNYAVVAVPVALIALFAPSAFVIGAVLACLLQVIVHAKWISQWRKAVESSPEPENSH